MAKLGLKGTVLFIICCSIGTIADIVLLNVLAHIMSETIANGISYIVGILVAFFLCRSFVFNAKDHTSRRLASTLIVHFVGLVVQQLLLNFLLKLGWGLNVSKIVTVVENAILMYFLNIIVVFREYKSQKSRASKNWVCLQFDMNALYFFNFGLK